jgi:hypothetical protein
LEYGELRQFALSYSREMPWVHGDWIDDEESLARPPMRWEFDPYLRQVFEQAGWKPLPPPTPHAAGDAEAYARTLLEEFGSLKLLEFSDGKYDIEFFTEPEPIAESEVKKSPILEGSMVIASIARGYEILIVDGRGCFFSIDGVIDGLRSLGDSFSSVANRLVRGGPWLPNLRDREAVSGHIRPAPNGLW